MTSRHVWHVVIRKLETGTAGISSGSDSKFWARESDPTFH